MAIALATTNPYYLAVVLMCIVLVGAVAPRTEQAVAGFRSLLVFGLVLVVISMGIALINSGSGSHVLFTIPSPQLPGWMGGLRLGGPATAESLVAAAIRGLAILCVLLAFGVFNGAVSPHRILRATPAALFQAGLVVTIGLTLLPSSIEDVRRIREMRSLRGARGGLRDLPALVVPAVIGGLERSMRLAEAMEARGYGVARPVARSARLAGAASAPLLLAAISLWSFAPAYRWLALIAALSGVGSLLAWFWIAARSRNTTRLGNDPVSLPDRILILLSLACGLLAVFGGGWLHSGYDPFANLPAPSFTIAGTALSLACVWPALRLIFTPVTRDAPSIQPATATAEPAAGEVLQP